MSCWECPSQVGYVYNRVVSFQVWSVGVYGLSRVGVLLPNHDRRASFSRQDSYSIGREVYLTSCGYPRQDGSRWPEPGSVKYQTCLIFCRSTRTSRKIRTDDNGLCKHCSQPSKIPSY